MINWSNYSLDNGSHDEHDNACDCYIDNIILPPTQPSTSS